jgi:hypothetical protein
MHGQQQSHKPPMEAQADALNLHGDFIEAVWNRGLQVTDEIANELMVVAQAIVGGVGSQDADRKVGNHRRG